MGICCPFIPDGVVALSMQIREKNMPGIWLLFTINGRGANKTIHPDDVTVSICKVYIAENALY
jgi:hypothetical protein